MQEYLLVHCLESQHGLEPNSNIPVLLFLNFQYIENSATVPDFFMSGMRYGYRRFGSRLYDAVKIRKVEERERRNRESRKR